MSCSGRQKKGKQKPPSNKQRVGPCPELSPKQCDSDAGSELGGTQDSIGMHTDLKPSQSLSPFLYNSMYCSEEELENMLLNKLESIYKQALAKLMSLGYPRDVVWNAILASGYVFGDEDILTNIVQNSVEYIKTNKSKCNKNCKDRPRVVENLKPSVKSSLAVMIFMLCQVQPSLKKIDAMRCLLMTNFDLGFASILTVVGKPSDGRFKFDTSKEATSSGAGTEQGDRELADSENSSSRNKRLAEEFEKFLGKIRVIVTGSNLRPSQQARLKKTVANLAGAFQADLKESSEEKQAEKNMFPGKRSTEQCEWEDSYMDKLMLDAIGESSFGEESETKSVDKKTKMISILVHDIEETKEEVKEQKEWAKKRVIEAAKKLSHELLELKALRMGKRKQMCESESGMLEQEERMMMRLLELENAMDQTTFQYDILNKASYDIENGNAEIRAEIEAYKLRTSESYEKIAKVANQEKKSVKKVMSLEKHNRRLLEEIEQERKKSLQLQQQMDDLQAAQEHIELLWRQEAKAKELALHQLQEERRLKEEAEVRIKSRQQLFQQKMETDRLKYKNEIRRLEQEISHLEMSSESSDDLFHLPQYLFSWESDVLEINADTFQNQLSGSSEQTSLSENEAAYYRVCMICMENEVSVLFLPCAHQVLCANCNNDYYQELEGRCLCCEELIDERIHVYGARS